MKKLFYIIFSFFPFLGVKAQTVKLQALAPVGNVVPFIICHSQKILTKDEPEGKYQILDFRFSEEDTLCVSYFRDSASFVFFDKQISDYIGYIKKNDTSFVVIKGNGVVPYINLEDRAPCIFVQSAEFLGNEYKERFESCRYLVKKAEVLAIMSDKQQTNLYMNAVQIIRNRLQIKNEDFFYDDSLYTIVDVQRCWLPKKKMVKWNASNYWPMFHAKNRLEKRDNDRPIKIQFSKIVNNHFEIRVNRNNKILCFSFKMSDSWEPIFIGESMSKF